MIKIPFFGLSRQYSNLREELLNAIDTVCSSGKLLDGENVEQFETQMARRSHREYAIAVNSCTQALIFVQQALDIQQKRVIIPTLSFAATLNSVLMVQNIPVYSDVDRHGMIDLETLRQNINSYKISALIYVNLFGGVVDYDRLRNLVDLTKNDELIIIEDAAQSFGARYKDMPSGKLGHVSVLSFDPTKNLPNYGSGGMILTDDRVIYQTLRNLRDNGKSNGHISIGTNSKMSEADCASMLVKLRYFDIWQKRRSEIAKFYIDSIKDYVRVTEVSDNIEHAWSKFPIWIDSNNNLDRDSSNLRDDVKNMLDELGIETRINYKPSLPELHVNNNSKFLRGRKNYPCGQCHSRTELSLPIYPELTDLEVEYIVENLIGCFRMIEPGLT